jgi:hypothetical protein
MRVLIDPNWVSVRPPSRSLGQNASSIRRFRSRRLPPVDCRRRLTRPLLIIYRHDCREGACRATGTRFVVPVRRPARNLVGVLGRAGGGGSSSFDWWESDTVGTLKLTATPTRHFSGERASGSQDEGRVGGLGDGRAAGPRHTTVGDTAMSGVLQSIVGARLGPFDDLDDDRRSGQYDGTQRRDVHLGPRTGRVGAHRMEKGRQASPCTWGLFDLGIA